MKIVASNILKFVLFIVLQVFFLKNLSLYGIPIPYMYVLFIILLPINTPYIVIYFSSFLLGFILDLFLNTPGIHAATCVITAFMRIILLNFIEHDDRNDKNVSLSSHRKSLKVFFIYTVILVVIHGLTLSMIEAADFSIFFTTIKSSLYSILLTASIILIILYLFGINKLKIGNR